MWLSVMHAAQRPTACNVVCVPSVGSHEPLICACVAFRMAYAVCRNTLIGFLGGKARD